MKSMKYTPGSFLEVDDLQGGRKVVMVGRDGVTFWDSVNQEAVTPLNVHDVFQPRELGTLTMFVNSRGLSDAAKRVLDFLHVHMDARENDSLFVMRMLWQLAPQASESTQAAVDEATLQAACEKAAQQEATALRIHERVAEYHQNVAG